MRKFNMITPEGTKDTLFEECRKRRSVERKAAAVFSARGYNEVITPGLEYYDVFDIEGASIPQYEMYKSTDNHGRLVVFRPDLTLPIARLTATRLQDMRPPMRLYYNQTVYRNRPDLSGRSDESTQAGIELIGAEGFGADIEVISTALELLNSCGINFRIEIGHAGLFRIIANKLPVTEELRESIRSTIESKNYAALGNLLEGLGNTPEVEALRRLPRLFGGEEVFSEAKRYISDEESLSILAYLETLYTAVEKLGWGDKVMVDLGLVQRNDYYTGVVFSAYTEGCGDAVVLGGRYDKLLEKFNVPMPAVGFAMNVDAVSDILMAKDGSDSIRKPKALVCAEEGFEAEAQLYIREHSSPSEIYENFCGNGLTEAKSYAESRGIDKLVIIAESTEKITIREINE